VYSWKVYWTSVRVGRFAEPQDNIPEDPATYNCSSPSDSSDLTCKLVTSVRNVQQVVLPSGGGNLKYVFSYADYDAPAGKKGWGELREVLLPHPAGDASGADGHRPRDEYK
jgi:hypothetical protein